MKWDFDVRTACPICLCSEYQTVKSIRYSETPAAEYLIAFYEGRIYPSDLRFNFELARCRRCRSFFQVYVLADHALPIFYENVVKSSLNAKEGRRTRRSVKRDHYFASIACRLGNRVLDFGAGWGHFLDVAQSVGLDTTAVEFNPHQAHHLARRHHVASLDEIDPESIDFVRADQVFEHVNHPVELLKSLSEKLSPKGVVAISVPPDFNPRFLNTSAQRIRREEWGAAKGSRWSMNDVAPLEHIQSFSDRGLRILGRMARMHRWQPPSPIRLRLFGNPIEMAQYSLQRFGLHTGTVFFTR